MAVVRVALVLVLLLTALLLQLTVLPLLGLPGATPDLLVVIVASLGLAAGEVRGAVAGFCAGLALDLVPPADGVLGLSAVVLTLVGYIAGLLGARKDRSAVVTIGAVALLAAGSVVAYAMLGGIVSDPRTSLVVSLDRAELESQQDEGVAVLKRLAGPLHTTYEALFERIQLCGTKYAVSGSCWNGSPFQPIPVAKDVSTALALSIMERRADFPGVMAQLESVREYPEIDGVNAAHMLGYLGAVSQGELTAQQQALDAGKIDAAQATLTGTDLVGRSGLEAQYDDQLRGKAGVKALSVDISANVIGTASETDPTPGDYVVTNVDARLQAVVEKQLLAAVKRARSTTQPGHEPPTSRTRRRTRRRAARRRRW